MLDPMIPLTLSLENNRGFYCLLLGSGISRNSQIPTGWEITLDLIRKIAAVTAEGADPDPAFWYRLKFGKEPDYSDLLALLASTTTERQSLIKRYIEPSEEDRQQGRKLPTKAHLSIAQLVKDGYVRVIVTTNFDRLIEVALDQLGIVPTVVSSEDSVKGSLPLQHAACTVLKIHGDYLDTRIRNTPDELSKYPPELDRLLDRIFDEYGVIVSGWSAAWDAALCAAINRCPNRRFPFYWAARGMLGDEAKQLINARRGVVIQTTGAGEFFSSLLEKVQALAQLQANDPLSPELQVVTAKRYLGDPLHRIRMSDLVTDEFQRVSGSLAEPRFRAGSDVEAEIRPRVVGYEAVTETLNRVLSAVAMWGNAEQLALCNQCLSSLARIGEGQTGITTVLHLMKYPALLCYYALGVSLVAKRRYAELKKLLDLKFSSKQPVWKVLRPSSVMQADHAAWADPTLRGRPFPSHQRVFDVLKKWIEHEFLEPSEFARAFHEFEIWTALEGQDSYHALVSLQAFDAEDPVRECLGLNNTPPPADWEPLKAGLAGGSPNSFESRLAAMQAAFAKSVGRWM